MLGYYEHISQLNNRLRHRIYHVKKEINHLKQLKRVFCERLLLHRAVIIDSNLEIPDNDSSITMADKIAGDTSNSDQQAKVAEMNVNGRKRKQKKAEDEEPSHKNKEPKQNKRRKVRDEGKQNIISIIESIVADTHRASLMDDSKDAESPGQTQVAEREEELVTKEEQMGGTEQEGTTRSSL